MSWYTPYLPDEDHFFRAIPKVELHRHLEGSLRLETLREIAQDYGMDIPVDKRFRSLVQMEHDDPLTFANFLSKFQNLRQFYRSPGVIDRVTREAIADAAADGVCYLELKFTPAALSRLQGFSLAEVMDWVLHSTREASEEYHLPTRLIVSVNRHEPVNLAEQILDLALERKSQGIVGIDLAGNEAEFSALPFLPMLRRARTGGLNLSIHAGEWGGPENIRQAIEDLQADRIGHGVRILEDDAVVQLAADRGIAFEVCITSNYQSGAVPALCSHPLPRMINAGLNVTINTDDPSISRITLSDEYRMVVEDLGVPLPVLAERILAAAQASFLPPQEKQALVQQIQTAVEYLCTFS